MNILLDLSWSGYLTRAFIGTLVLFLLSVLIEKMVKGKRLAYSTHTGIAIGTGLVTLPAFLSIEFTILSIIALSLKFKAEAKLRSTRLAPGDISSKCLADLNARKKWSTIECFNAMISSIMTLVYGLSPYPVSMLIIFIVFSSLLLTGSFRETDKAFKVDEIKRLRSLR